MTEVAFCHLLLITYNVSGIMLCLSMQLSHLILRARILGEVELQCILQKIRVGKC